MKVILFVLLVFASMERCAFGDEESWVPNFLIIGAQKAGTSALYKYIKQHPKVKVVLREIHFFDLSFPKGKEWYKMRFCRRPEPDFVIGDKSPYYIFHPEVPKRVYSMFPQIKILVMLRNPVDRAYSHYCMNVRKGFEKLPFKKALEAESKRIQGAEAILKKPGGKHKNHLLFSYLQRGIYVKQLERWFSYFPRSQFMIIGSQDLRNDPIKVLNDVYEFLELSPYTINIEDNEKHSKYPPMKPAVRASLSEFYQPYNLKLEKLLDMQFDWNSR